MKTRTYQTKDVARACEEFGAVDLTYIDTIAADGTVTSTVRGTSDGDYVNVTKTRKVETPIDWERVHEARVRSGWRLSAEEE